LNLPPTSNSTSAFELWNVVLFWRQKLKFKISNTNPTLDPNRNGSNSSNLLQLPDELDELELHKLELNHVHTFKLNNHQNEQIQTSNLHQTNPITCKSLNELEKARFLALIPS